MKVKFVVTYNYEPSDEYPYKAEITLHMPSDPKRKDYLHTLLQSRRHKVLGSCLHRMTGKMDNEQGTIYLQKTVCASSWEEVKQEVTYQVTEALTTLQEVKRANERAYEAMPDDEEFEFEI